MNNQVAWTELNFLSIVLTKQQSDYNVTTFFNKFELTFTPGESIVITPTLSTTFSLKCFPSTEDNDRIWPEICLHQYLSIRKWCGKYLEYVSNYLKL